MVFGQFIYIIVQSFLLVHFDVGIYVFATYKSVEQ